MLSLLGIVVVVRPGRLLLRLPSLLTPLHPQRLIVFVDNYSQMKLEEGRFVVTTSCPIIRARLCK